MTTELTKAAQQALEALKLCYAVVEYPANGTSRQDKAIAALERALTQRPAAQTEQATPEPVGEPLGYIPTDAIDQIKTPPRLITRNVPVLSYAADGYTAIYTRPAPGVPEWQPIETAPKDGRDLILLLTPSGFPQVTYSNTWWQSGLSVECRPTGWMPLPAHPLAAAQAKGGQP